LGLLYFSRNKLGDAEEVCKRLLQRYNAAYSPEHTSTLNIVHHLGGLYKSQGKPKEAEETYRRALQGYENTLGVDNIAGHQPALNTMRDLGHLLAAQGHPDEAKEMYSKALTGFRALLGPSSDECQLLECSIASLDPAQGI
jgi:tetratricopeptide (TPR) repeat protein